MLKVKSEELPGSLSLFHLGFDHLIKKTHNNQYMYVTSILGETESGF